MFTRLLTTRQLCGLPVANPRFFFFFSSQVFGSFLKTTLMWQLCRRIPEGKDFGRRGAIWPFLSFTFRYPVLQPILRFFLYRRNIKFWKNHLQLKQFLVGLLFLYYYGCIKLQLIGIGYSCILLSPKVLQVLTAYNHDILYYAANTIFFTQARAKTQTQALKTFTCFSWDVEKLRIFTSTVRRSLKFNPYEYRGLLYLKETHVKKITKQKMR